MAQRPLKAVFVNRFFYPDISATSQMLGDLAFALAARGHDISVITSRQLYQDTRARLPSREDVQGVKIYRVRGTHFGRANLVGRALDYASFYVTATFRLWKLARQDIVVIAKTDPPLISLFAAWVCKLRRAKLVNWIQDLFPEVAIASQPELWRALPGRLLTRLRDASLRSAQCNVVLGTRMAETLRKITGDSSHVALIPNWIDGRLVTPVKAEDNVLRREWGLSEKFVVQYSGNMGRVHEFATILRTIRLAKPMRDMVFLFVGEGKWRNELERLATQERLDSVVLRPYQPMDRLSLSLSVGDVHLVTLLPQMEGLVVPSKFYGIAAAARPCVYVGDPNGEIGQLISRNRLGFTFSPGDDKGLLEALLDLQRNVEKRTAMGMRARTLFDTEFNKPLAIGKWETVLLGVADAQGV